MVQTAAFGPPNSFGRDQVFTSSSETDTLMNLLPGENKLLQQAITRDPPSGFAITANDGRSVNSPSTSESEHANSCGGECGTFVTQSNLAVVIVLASPK